LSQQPLLTWARLLRGHALVTRELNARLVAEQGLTINEHEVLLRLAHAPEGRMRRVDLADQVLLTPSGITRLLDRLERIGYVDRASCASDRRVTYAVLTDAGLDALRASAEPHLAAVDDLFAARFDEGELETLAELLGRLSGEDDEACSPPDGA
jgi:DNA-binding MarR family transcriptional regulator